MHMIDRRVRRTCRARRTARFNNRSATLLHDRNELLGVPLLIHQGHRRSSCNGCRMNVWKLRCGMIAPNAQTLHIRRVLAGFQRELCGGTVVIKAHHGSELTRIQRRRIALRDQAIGVRGIANHQNLHTARGAIIQRLALHGKDRGVRFDEILALHTLAARA